MAEPFLGEIRMFGFNFAPKGWALCNGQLMPINQNQALFSIMGTTYGGDGRVTFALPEMRGRTPVYQGQGLVQGAAGGASAVTLTQAQLPGHSHNLVALAPQNGSANVAIPTGNFLSNSSPAEIYTSGSGGPSFAALSGPSVSNYGGNQPHENMQPYLVINFCVALQGIFPSRT